MPAVKRISFLSDYGLADHFVGVCHGVIAQIAPQAEVIDIAHELPPCAIVPAALTLRSAIPYMPLGITLAVVDPSVGTERGAVAIETADRRLFVGPDNGLLMPAAELCGGVVEAVDIRSSPAKREPTSATFHGRDIFAPVAARLSAGSALGELGEPFNPDNLHRLELFNARVERDELLTYVLHVDRFGNVQLDAGPDLLKQLAITSGDQLELVVGKRSFPATFATTFAEVMAGELLLFTDSAQLLSIAVNRDSAARWLTLGTGTQLKIRTE